MIAFFSSSSSSFAASSFSSSSYSSSSLLAIKYINRGDYPDKFDYAVWKLNMFLCSHIKLPITGKYLVKCIECNWTNDLSGTNALANHAESKHRDLPRVAEWLAEKMHLLMKNEIGNKIVTANWFRCALVDCHDHFCRTGICRKWRSMTLMGFFDLWRIRKLVMPILINCWSSGDLLLLLPLPSLMLLLISLSLMVIMHLLLKEKGFNTSWSLQSLVMSVQAEHTFSM